MFSKKMMKDQQALVTQNWSESS